jgi:cellulase
MFSTLLSLILVAPSVLGHGQVRNFIASSGVWSAADAYAAAKMSSPIRKLDGYGPAADFTNSSITCGVRSSDGAHPLSAYKLPPVDRKRAHERPCPGQGWRDRHLRLGRLERPPLRVRFPHGSVLDAELTLPRRPVMTYIASCGAAGCANFKGDTGAVWVKIDQDVCQCSLSLPTT